MITALLPGYRTLHVVNITWHALEVMQTFDLTLESITILHVVSFAYVARSLESVLAGLGYPPPPFVYNVFDHENLNEIKDLLIHLYTLICLQYFLRLIIINNETSIHKQCLFFP